MLQRFGLFSSSTIASPSLRKFRVGSLKASYPGYRDPEDFFIPRSTTEIDLEAVRIENEKWKRADAFNYPMENYNYRSSHQDENSTDSPRIDF